MKIEKEEVAKAPKPLDRNKSRHRPGYFTEYMRKYRARKAQERLNPSQAKLK